MPKIPQNTPRGKVTQTFNSFGSAFKNLEAHKSFNRLMDNYDSLQEHGVDKGMVDRFTRNQNKRRL